MHRSISLQEAPYSLPVSRISCCARLCSPYRCQPESADFRAYQASGHGCSAPLLLPPLLYASRSEEGTSERWPSVGCAFMVFRPRATGESAFPDVLTPRLDILKTVCDFLSVLGQLFPPGISATF